MRALIDRNLKDSVAVNIDGDKIVYLGIRSGEITIEFQTHVENILEWPDVGEVIETDIPSAESKNGHLWLNHMEVFYLKLAAKGQL